MDFVTDGRKFSDLADLFDLMRPHRRGSRTLLLNTSLHHGIHSCLFGGGGEDPTLGFLLKPLVPLLFRFRGSFLSH